MPHPRQSTSAIPGAAPLSRRDLLSWAAAGSAGIWLPPRAWAGLRPALDPFALGVASGSPASDSVVLWTRLVLDPEQEAALKQGDVAVRWEVAHDDGFRQPVQSGQAPAPAALGRSVHVEVQGLEPDRWYFYRFVLGDAVSATGRTRTFPAPGAAVARLRMAYASCQRWESGYYSAYRHMQREELDVVMFLGDYIYEYPNAPKGVRASNGGWVLTLDDYRRRYALHRSDADLQAMHASCPWMVTWDDHEVQNNYAGLSPGNSGTPVADFAARRAAAYQAWYENMPVPVSMLSRGTAGLQAGAALRIYQRVPYGRLAALYMLDARQHKDTQVCTGEDGKSSVNPAKCPEWNKPRSMLGAQQERWLDAEFGKAASRESAWNVVNQQTLFGQRDRHRGPGQRFGNDGWDGYAAARTRLTDALQKHKVNNPVMIGGDVHENWVGHIKADYNDATSRTLGVEFCGTSITSHSAGNEKIPERLAENPHFVFADAERRGYGVAEFTPGRLTTTLRVVSDVKSRSSGIETLARFSVPAGQAAIERT